MSNDKGTKDPDAVAVDLNIDKDRIMGDVAEKVQWTFTKNEGRYKFAVGENNLYATSDGLRVGTETSNNEFDFSTLGRNGKRYFLPQQIHASRTLFTAQCPGQV